MRRKKLQNLSALKSALQEPAKKVWKTYHCTLVTPMYGGGVEAGTVDCNMPIRASSIRGQLRFWWRIACGPFKSTKEMFEQESAIWGGIGDDGANASKVEIRIRFFNVSPSSRKTIDEFKRQSAIGIQYVLGSINGSSAKLPSILPNGKNTLFDIDIYSPEKVKPDVEIALRWWASFGGVGSRTRRGLGAVKVNAKDDILLPVSIEEVEGKGGVLTLVSSSEPNAVTCWRYGCDKLRDFRQGKNVGRNPPAQDSRSPAGRSRWTEADSIRNLVNTHSKKHPPANKQTNSFPRAAFGLPIVFHYQQDNMGGQEPKDHTLKVADKDKERMASPLILRPYYDGKQWKAAALLLPKWQEALTQKLVLDPKPKEQPQHWPSDPNERQSLAMQISPMKKKEGSLRANDPLSAFLDYFEKGQ